MHGDAAVSPDPEFPNLRPEVADAFRSAPANVVAEIVGGEISRLPRPRTAQASAASVLGEELGPPFRRGRGGPGGWVFLDAPELRLGARPDVLVPDLAGWRRERVPDDFIDRAVVGLAPDWVCEVLSPSTEAFDRGEKLGVYHRERVLHAWLVSPALRTLEVFRRADVGWLLVTVVRGDAPVRAEPFDAVEFELGALWRV